MEDEADKGDSADFSMSASSPMVSSPLATVYAGTNSSVVGVGTNRRGEGRLEDAGQHEIYLRFKARTCIRC